MLAILATSYCLNRKDRVRSFYWTRGSKLCFLTCFSYFSRYFHILVFLRNRYLLIFFVPFSAAWESDFSSRFSYHWHSELVHHICAPQSYVVEDWRIRGPNVLTFVLVTGSCQFFAVGCYIPPNNLSTLTTIEQAWNKCPRRHIPLLLGNLNVNLHSPRDERDKQIAKVVEDVMGLTDLSQHFRQQSRGSVRGRWTWRMRRGKRWISSQCDYVLGRVTNRRKYCSIRLRTP
jgi:hypothetical protein